MSCELQVVCDTRCRRCRCCAVRDVGGWQRASGQRPREMHLPREMQSRLATEEGAAEAQSGGERPRSKRRAGPPSPSSSPSHRLPSTSLDPPLPLLSPSPATSPASLLPPPSGGICCAPAQCAACEAPLLVSPSLCQSSAMSAAASTSASSSLPPCHPTHPTPSSPAPVPYWTFPLEGRSTFPSTSPALPPPPTFPRPLLFPSPSLPRPLSHSAVPFSSSALASPSFYSQPHQQPPECVSYEPPPSLYPHGLLSPSPTPSSAHPPPPSHPTQAGWSPYEAYGQVGSAPTAPPAAAMPWQAALAGRDAGWGRASMRPSRALDEEEERLVNYRTELCEAQLLSAFCPHSSSCQFAHSFDELRPKHYDSKFKTELCQRTRPLLPPTAAPRPPALISALLLCASWAPR